MGTHDLAQHDADVTALLPSPEETRAAGEALGAVLLPGDIVGLVGTLGSGKTTIAKGIAAGLGVSDTRQVMSPTYVLIRRYVGRLTIHHFDAYRLASSDDLLELGADELFAGDGVCLVEWSDHVLDAMPPERLTLYMRILGPTSRHLRLTGHGSACRARMGSLRAALAPWADDPSPSAAP